MIDLEEARLNFKILKEGRQVTKLPDFREDIYNFGNALIQNIESLRKELTEYHKQDNQEHRLIAKIEILEAQLEETKEKEKKLRELLNPLIINFAAGVARADWPSVVQILDDVIKFTEGWDLLCCSQQW